MSNYTPENWEDRSVTDPNNATITKAGGGAISSGDTVAIVANPTAVSKAGTSITASVMNNVEKGIQDASVKRKGTNLLPDLVARAEDDDDITTSGITLTLDTDNQYKGKSCYKCTLTASTGYIYYDFFDKIEADSYYLLTIRKLQGNLGTGIRIELDSDVDDLSGVYTKPATWTRTGLVVSADNLDGATYARLKISFSGTSGQYGYVDALQVTKISKYEYDKGTSAIWDGLEFMDSEGFSTLNEITALDDEETLTEGRMDGLLIGRSDVNLFDDDVAGCESTSGWDVRYCTVAIDSSNELEGTNCLKITATSTFGYAYRNILSKLDVTKYYMISVHLSNNDFTTGIRLTCNAVSDGGVKSSSYEDGSTYKRVAVAYEPSEINSATAFNLRIDYSGSSSEYGFVDAIAIQEITAEDYNSLSDPTDASDLFDKYPYHRGLVGSGVGRVKSDGKNLFDASEYDTLDVGYDLTYPFNSPNGNVIYRQFLGVLSLKAGTYTFSSNSSIAMKMIDSEDVEITPTPQTLPYTFTFTEDKIIGFLIRKTDSSTWDLAEKCTDLELQLELGSTATTYQPYKSSQAYSQAYNDRELYSVPNGTHDSKDLNTGKYVKRVKRYVLQSGDITAISDLTNNQRIRTKTLENQATFTTNDLGKILVAGFPEVGNDGVDDIAQTVSTVTTSTNYVNLYVPLGTYADLAAAQADLAGTVIHYELDPAYYETYYDQPQVLQAFPNGTIYNEFAICEQLTYTDSKITITDTNYPISSLDFVYKVEYETDGEIIKTPVDISDCTVASDGLTFTITDAVNEEYEFAYYYFGGATRAELKYMPCINQKDQMNGNSQDLRDLDNKVDSLNNKVDTKTSDNASDISTLQTNLNEMVDWETIADYTVEGSADSQIDFDSISTDYTDFMLIFEGQSSTGTERHLYLNFNDETTGTNYTYSNYVLNGNGAFSNASQSEIGLGDTALLSNTTPDNFSYGVVKISNPDNYKNVIIDVNYSSRSSTLIKTTGGAHWSNTDKITKISLTPSADAIGVGSRFLLLGRRDNS